jgi:hypothetical protein
MERIGFQRVIPVNMMEKIFSWFPTIHNIKRVMKMFFAGAVVTSQAFFWLK